MTPQENRMRVAVDRAIPEPIGGAPLSAQVSYLCPAGHAFDEANTRIDRKGARQCRACERERKREARRREREARLVAA